MRNPYDLIAEQWHSTSRAQAYLERTLRYVDLAIRDLPPEAKVLDMGCGTGSPIAEHLIQRGFRVVGVDQSAKMLEIARKVIPAAELIHDDMVSVELSGKFSAAIAWDSLFHVAREHHAAIYRKLAGALESGGRLLLSVGGSGSEGFTSEMYGQTFFYSGYEPEVTRGLLETAGFKIELWEIDDPSSREHIAVIARKAT